MNNDLMPFPVPSRTRRLFRPPIASKIDAETGKWLGKDIVLTLQGGHFTYLTPTGANIIDHPVDAMLQYARRGRFQIATPMDFFAPSFEEADRIRYLPLTVYLPVTHYVFICHSLCIHLLLYQSRHSAVTIFGRERNREKIEVGGGV